MGSGYPRGDPKVLGLARYSTVAEPLNRTRPCPTKVREKSAAE
jgi:hypothetical protein